MIRPFAPRSADDLQPLLDASLAEGYSFVRKLWDEYTSGQERFDAPGAQLLAAYDETGALVAVGGVHPDPYAADPTVGRVRHVYVMPAARRTGIGGRLVRDLIAHAAQQFSVLTLRTMTDHGAAFYTALGFSSAPRFPDATHWLDLSPTDR